PARTRRSTLRWMGWRDAVSTSSEVRTRWYSQHWWREYIAYALLYTSMIWVASRFWPALREMRDLGVIVLNALVWVAGFQIITNQYPRMKRWFESRIGRRSGSDR